ncbi:MAG: PBP1A family penicillin-binding protein [bacterium]|nr:PBP1A family penicillin-binding protein [bacterium]
MNYGRRSARKKQKTLVSKSTKIGKMIAITFFNAVLVCALSLAVIGACAGVGLFKGVIATAPDISNIDVSPTGFSTTVYDKEGNTLTKLVAADSNRIYVTIDKIPEDFQHAFVAIEDERFYTHPGIDIKGIMRAGVVGLQKGNFSEGASTITQQLLKNNVFTSWTSESSMVEKFKRKFQEQYLALELEKIMDKETILENYMNTINLGQSTLGVQAASQRYFGKTASQITLSEAAVIAAITQNPTKFNPISHPDYNMERRTKVLDNMLEQGYITQGEHDEALADDVYSRIQNVNAETEKNSIYTYFVDTLTEEVINDLQEMKGYSYTQAYNALYSGGLSIYTTQDPNIQRICDEEFSNPENFPENTKLYLTYELSIENSSGEMENFSTQNFESYFKQQNKKFNSIFDTQEEAQACIDEYKASVMGPADKFVAENINYTPQPQVSISVIDHTTGQVSAIVGGRGTKQASLTLNRATDTNRQPGSTFKVLAAYAPALDSAGFTLASTQVDEPFNYANGRPVSNWYSTGYKGICTVRYGIEQSLNIVAVKTLTDITPQLGYDYLLNFGFTTLVDRRTQADGTVTSDITQALALGGVTDGVTNLELTSAYGAIANGGTYIKPMFYTKIVDHDGNVLIENAPQKRQVIKETTAFLLTDAMTDVVTQGTGGKVRFDNMSIAGKTGTTSSDVDVWFAGYTPYYTCATWAGYDNNVHMGGSETGLAKTLWKAVMSRVHENLENKSFTTPEGITSATVCNKSGKLAVAGLCDLDGSAYTEYFATGTQPTTVCDRHMVGYVCGLTGGRAADSCPYKVQGVIMVDPENDPYASTPYCIHSYINGVPMFSVDGTGLPEGTTVNGAGTVLPDATSPGLPLPDASQTLPGIDPNTILPQ